MKSSVNRLIAAGIVLLAWLPGLVLAGYADVLNMPVGVTEISREVYALHMRIFWICVVIGLLVFSVMFYSMFQHRKSRGAVAATFHESTTVEIVWTIVPFVILVAMAWPAAKVLIKMEDFSDSEMTIKVTAYQWRWHYDYLEEGISFYSQLDAVHNVARQVGSDIDVTTIENYLKEVDNPLVVPVGKKIRFLHTAADVIHSWWVPDLAIKKDSIPGFITENWAKIDKPGIYRGKCAELCGRDHGFMPIVVQALSQEDYAAWVKVQQAKAMATNTVVDNWTYEKLVQAGEQVYQRNCAACHQAEGQGIPGMFPAIGGSDIATGAIERHLDTVVNGVAGTPMQAFGSKLANADLAAVLTYQRNAFGNNTGDTIWPEDVQKLRDGQRQSMATETRLVPELILTGADR